MAGKPSTVVGTCGLCRAQDVNLCYSDLLPKAVNRWIRLSMGDGENPNPVLVTRRIATTSNFRVAEYLLCPQCEDRFNKGGESWVLAHAYRGTDSFPMRAALATAPSIMKLSQASLIDARPIPQISLDKLVYFAASVFWRAGACRWRAVDHYKQEFLGPYQEKLRRFLLGQEAFPDRAALLINVSGNVKPHLGAIYPYSGRVNGTWQHRFAIPGLAFWLHLGNLPAALKRFCAVRFGIVCFVPNLDETFEIDMAKLILTATPSHSLRGIA